jgi:RNA polymerase sigma-70 factor (ECF subfamily)
MRRRAVSVLVVMKSEAPVPAVLCAWIEAVARSRDRAAFADLFAHFAPRVKGYLMRLGASGGLAEDLAQEAMLTLWRKAALFDPAKASASTWVFTIARNLRIDAIRRERHPEVDPAELAPEPERAADAGMMRVEDDARVREALATLPKEQVQVIELSFYADKPHSTIAQELGLPLGTVKSRLRLAMARIRSALGEEA